MISQQPESNNPTSSVNLNFIHYLERRRTKLSEHVQGAVSDYSFSLDGKLRQQISSAGPVRSIAQILVSASAPMQAHRHEVQSIAVGPDQYDEIYALGEDCARRLGIAIPRIFVMTFNEPAVLTLIGDSIAPTIVISSCLRTMLDLNELKFIIGHECGHIHNQHGIYNTAVIMLVDPIAKLMLQNLISVGASLGAVRLAASAIYGGLRLFLMNWSRCADITCDRAGLICCGDLQVAENALIKLVTGGSEQLEGFNIEAYLKQIAQAESVSHRYVRMTQPYLMMATRIEALRLFAQCDVYKQWRPESKGDSLLMSREDVDRKCEQMLGF
jgi:Zn-dependent protease with chaperone function